MILSATEATFPVGPSYSSFPMTLNLTRSLVFDQPRLSTLIPFDVIERRQRRHTIKICSCSQSASRIHIFSTPPQSNFVLLHLRSRWKNMRIGRTVRVISNWKWRKPNLGLRSYRSGHDNKVANLVIVVNRSRLGTINRYLQRIEAALRINADVIPTPIVWILAVVLWMEKVEPWYWQASGHPWSATD